MKLEELKKLIRKTEDIADEKETQNYNAEAQKKATQMPFYAGIVAGVTYMAGVGGMALYGVGKVFAATAEYGPLVSGFALTAATISIGSATMSWLSHTVEPVSFTALEIVDSLYSRRVKTTAREKEIALRDEKEIKTVAKAIENGTLSEHLTEQEANVLKTDKDNYIVLKKTKSTVEELALMEERNIYDSYQDRKNLLIASMGFHTDGDNNKIEAFTVIQSDYIANCKDSFIVDKRNAHSMIVLRNIPSDKENEKLQLVEEDVDLSNLSTREGKKAVLQQISLTNMVNNNANVFRNLMDACAKRNNMYYEIEHKNIEKAQEKEGRLKPLQKETVLNLNKSLYGNAR